MKKPKEYLDFKCLRNLYSPPDSSLILERIEIRRKQIEEMHKAQNNLI